jgi:hypothetical protein
VLLPFTRVWLLSTKGRRRVRCSRTGPPPALRAFERYLFSELRVEEPE